MSQANVIIDANIALHYRRVDQIDWRSLIHAEECHIIILPVLMRELERKKATGSSAVIKKRAGRAIDYFAKKMDEDDPIILREGCALVFHDNEPLIDFPANRLSQSVDDDHYIACALEIAEESGCPTIIASADSGLKLKLRSRTISILTPPDDLRLQEELDKEALERREMKRELEKLRSARPKLALAFENGEDKLKLAIPEKIIADLKSIELIQQEYPLEETPTREVTVKPLSLGSDLSIFDPTSTPRYVEKRNARIRSYYEKYQQYISAYENWLSYICLIDWIEFRIDNHGAAAASNVEMSIEAPPGTVWMDDSDLPDRPKEPENPNSFAATTISPLSYLSHMHPPKDGDTYVRKSGRLIVAECSQLNPGCSLTLEKGVLKFDDRSLVGKSMSFQTRISYTEGEPIAAQLPFQVISAGVIERPSS